MSPSHDKAYKDLFSHPEFVKQLLEGFVPQEISERLDYTTLTIHPGNYITPLAEERIEDLVWSVKMHSVGDEPPVKLYLYLLLEFQSKTDATMSLRMLHYVASFYHQLIKQEKISLRKDRLPPVFPLVLYNGERTWRVATEMTQIIQPVPDVLQAFQPQLQYFLIDEKRLKDDYLASRSQPLSDIFSLEKLTRANDFFIVIDQLRHKLQHHPERERIEKAILGWLNHYYLPRHDFHHNLETMEHTEELSAMFSFKQELEETGRKAMQRGMQKGRQEGMQEGQLVRQLTMLRHLLKKRFGTLPEWAVERLQQADITQLEQWSENIFDAESLTDFFEL